LIPLDVLDYLGTFAFALSGALKAAQHRLDVFGVSVLAVITAVGGGTVRDLMLGARPIFWLDQPAYLLVALIPALLVFAWYRPMARTERPLVYADAVGLGVFTVIGASKALDQGTGVVGAVVFGCLTGVGGGVIRDVLVREVPLVLRREVYASATVAGSILYCALNALSAPAWLALLVGATTVIAVRVICIRRAYHLPGPQVDDGPEPPTDPPE